MTFELSAKQQNAVDLASKWFDERTKNPKSTPQEFYLAGYAGSGKTSIAKALVERLFPNVNTNDSDYDADEEDEQVAPPYTFAAYTGKASLVLSRKNCKPVSTIHGLIYSVYVNPSTQAISFTRRYNLPHALQLIVPDECSMINDEMARDLLHFRKSMLYLGDPGQLPPVEGDSYFATRSPDVFLDEIHRQAGESPILQAATLARNGESLSSAKYNNTESSSLKLLEFSPSWKSLLDYDQVLCGTNKTRAYLNQNLRIASGFATPSNKNPLPQKGEKLLCTRNNWNVPGMVNGSLWEVLSCESLPPQRMNFKGETITANDRLALSLQSWDLPDKRQIEVTSHAHFFDEHVPKPKTPPEWSGLTQFTYGYAISVHKSQGSEWDNVFLFNESASFREDRKKWLYTGITRAAKHLTIRL